MSSPLSKWTKLDKGYSLSHPPPYLSSGSERQSKTDIGADAQRMKEAERINMSLLILGRCLSASADGIPVDPTALPLPMIPDIWFWHSTMSCPKPNFMYVLRFYGPIRPSLFLPCCCCFCCCCFPDVPRAMWYRNPRNFCSGSGG